MDSKNTNVIHEIRRALHEAYNVPPHPPRTESDLYKATHHDLVNVKDTPCFICGVTNSTLNDPAKNPFQAKDLETHHFKIEWSLANAMDWHKMKLAYPDFADWDKINPDDESTYFWFVDSEYNMLVLCDVHHRGNFHGIHAVEHAVWLAQKFVKDGYTFIDDSAKHKAKTQFE